MLIKLDYLSKKYGFKPKGVLHVGAHLGEEAKDYNSLDVKNVIWVEGNEKLIDSLKLNLEGMEGHQVLEYLVSDLNDKEYDFNISNNGQSSSILEMDKHLIYHPQVRYIDSVKVKSKRIDTIIKDNGIDIGDYDFLNLDIQGAELIALKGMGETIKGFKYIYTEVNIGEVYKGCAKINEIDDYIGQYGFERVETKITPSEWGDAFYIKK